LVIRCMDFRFHEYLEANLEKLLGKRSQFFDSPGAGGGGSRSIIDETSRKVVFNAVDIGQEKHGIKRIVIADHIDCGAYGGSGKFSGEVEEEKFHKEQLRLAKEIMAKKYPSLEIVIIYQDWDKIKVIS